MDFSENETDAGIGINITNQFKNGNFLPLLAYLDNYFIDLAKSKEEAYGRIGVGGSHFFEKIRLKSEPQFSLKIESVQKSQINTKSLRRANQDIIDLYLNGFNLFNTNGPLPAHMTSLVASRIKEKDSALSEFLDIFQHVFMSILYKSWRKHSLNFIAQDSRQNNLNPQNARILSADFVTAFTGIEKTSFDANFKFFNFFMKPWRSGDDFCRMLSYYLNVPVKIEDGGDELVTPKSDDFINPDTGELEWGDVQGIRMYDAILLAGTKLRYVLGPMSYERYLDFHPDKILYADICRLIEDYSEQPHITYTVKFIVSGTPAFSLDANLTLGFDTWFTTNESKEVVSEFQPVARNKRAQQEIEKNSEKKFENTHILPEDFSHYIHTASLTQVEKFYEYFKREKIYLTELASDFVQEHAKAAENLGFNRYGQSDDPEVQRLFELSSFMIAHLRQKMDEPALDPFAERLLQEANPNLFLPIPAFSIVQVNLQEGTSDSIDLAQGTEISLSNEEENILFRTVTTTTLIPAKVTGVKISHSFQAKDLNKNKQPFVKNTLLVDLECLAEKGFANLNLKTLRFFIHLPIELAFSLYESLFCDLMAVAFYDMSGKEEKYMGNIYAPHALQLVGLGEDETVIPRPYKQNNNQFNTHARHLMHEFSVYPDKFLFFDVTYGKEGLQEKLKTCGKKLQIRFFLKNHLDKDVVKDLNEKSLCLNAVPIVNLFYKNIPKILSGKIEIDIEQELNSNHLIFHSVDSISLQLQQTSMEVTVHNGSLFSKDEGGIYWKLTSHDVMFSKNKKLKFVDIAGNEISLDSVHANLNFVAMQKEIKSNGLVANLLLKSKKIEEIILLKVIQRRKHRLKNYANLRRLSMAQFFHDPIRTMTRIIEGSVFESESIHKIIQSLEFVKKEPFVTESTIKNEKQSLGVMNKGILFEFSLKSMDARKNGAFLFLHLFSKILAENCMQTSSVRFGYHCRTKILEESQKYFYPVMAGSLK